MTQVYLRKKLIVKRLVFLYDRKAEGIFFKPEIVPHPQYYLLQNRAMCNDFSIMVNAEHDASTDSCIRLSYRYYSGNGAVNAASVRNEPDQCN